MAEQNSRMLNPFLALVQLYTKEGKSFKDVIGDITTRLNTLSFELDEKYIKDKVLPWILSFLYMSLSEQLLREYIQNLSKVTEQPPTKKGPPSPPPAEMP